MWRGAVSDRALTTQRAVVKAMRVPGRRASKVA
jgi:hypothetical protein